MSTPIAVAAPQTPALSDARALAPWYAVEFLNSFAATLLTTGCFDYATKSSDIHASASAVLWLSAAWGFAYIPIALLSGRNSEHWGPRKSALIMSTASIATALLGLLSVLVPAVWVIWLIMIPYNLTSTHIWPAVESALTRTPAKMKLSARMALYNVSWGSAGFVALFTRGYLEEAGWIWIFIAPAIASALGAFILYRWGIPASMISKDHVPPEEESERDLDAPGMRQRAKTLLLMAFVGNCLAYVAINVLTPLLAKLATLADIHSLSSGGMITSVWSFTRFAGFALVFFWTGWHYKARWLITAQFILAAAILLMLTTHIPLLFVGVQIVFGLAAALIYSSALYYAMHTSDGHGGHAGLHEALIGVGIALGPTIGALAGTGELGPAALNRIAIGVTALLLVGTALMLYLNTRKHSTPAQNPVKS